MPRVEQRPLTVRVTHLETYSEYLGVYHGIRAWSGRVLVVLLDTRIVREVFALREDAFGVELLKL
jgi:hypothetical protein